MRMGVALVLALALGGCAMVDDDELSVESAEQGLLGLNGLLPSAFWPNLSSYQTLLQGPFTDNASTKAILNTANGDMVMTYLARCALAAGDKQEFTLPSGGTLGVEGAIGLAKSWKTRGLTQSEKDWMGACVGSLLNSLPYHVWIDMRGAHPALKSDPKAQATFQGQESGRYMRNGEMHFCVGEFAKKMCPASAVSSILHRGCAGSNATCAMQNDGDCSRTCTVASDGTLVNCNGSGAVITVFLDGNVPYECFAD